MVCIAGSIALPQDPLDPVNDYLSLRMSIIYLIIPGMGTFMFQALSLLAVVELLRLFAVLDERITSTRLFYMQMYSFVSAFLMNSPLAVSIVLTWQSIAVLLPYIGICFASPFISLILSAVTENVLLWFIGALVSRKAAENDQQEALQQIKKHFQKFTRMIVVVTVVGVTILSLGITQFIFYHVFDFAFLSFSLLPLKTATQIWIFQECRKVALLKRKRRIPSVMGRKEIPIDLSDKNHQSTFESLPLTTTKKFDYQGINIEEASNVNDTHTPTKLM